MKDKIISLKENAKDEWLKLVDKHKKKQRGLPALSKLNTNAGNVEHNVSMFNKMNGPSEGPVNNPISGPFGGDVSAATAAMGESLIKEGVDKDSTVTLYYEKLRLDDFPTGRIIRSNDYYQPDEYETKDIVIEYEYEVPEEEIIELLLDNPEVQESLTCDIEDYEACEAEIHENIENIVEEYSDYLLDHYEDKAKEHAYNNFDYEYYFGESYSEKDSIDDNFDMSMRTLI